MKVFNYGYDDEIGDYKTKMNDHIGYRYQVQEPLGSGSFGQALKCVDHKTQELVAIKIIRNQKKFQYQAGMELKIVKFLNNHDKDD
jgi:dual specificity tyrosine-phosphorylation-regulated kinase 2/3/4